jgi:hypothetical protein
VSRPTIFLVLVLAVLAGACGGEEDTREASWGYISPAIIAPNCATASCHSRAAAVAGLDLSTFESGYNGLLLNHLKARTDGVEVLRPLVSPFNPDESRMVNMLRARGARRMPPDRPLAEADIRLIERWILNGATNE